MQNSLPQEYVYANPVIVYGEQEDKKIKGHNRIISFIAGCVILLLCILITIAGIYVVRDYLPGNVTPTPSDNINIIPTDPLDKISDYSQVRLNEDYVTRVLPLGVKAYRRPQIDLLFKIFQMAEQRRWTGSFSTELGFTYKDFEQEFHSLLTDYRNYISEKALSSEMEGLLIGNNKDKVKSYLIEARTDFLQKIKTLGFSQTYIDEIDSYVLPDLPERITYISDNYDSDNYIGSSTKPLNGDYGRRFIQIDPRDIYYVYKDLSKTLFGMRLNEDELIEACTKMVMYHELGHVLIQSFINSHVPDEIKRLGSEDMWLHSDVDFLEPGINHYWAWSYNKQIEDERIAQGLMIKVFYMQYNISEDDQNDIYDIVVEKDNYNMNTIYSLGLVLHTQYDDLLSDSWAGLHNYLLNYLTSSEMSDVNIQLINKMLGVIEQLPAYIGYFNPAVDKDWQFFTR